jgi:hypothetical protein
MSNILDVFDVVAMRRKSSLEPSTVILYFDSNEKAENAKRILSNKIFNGIPLHLTLHNTDLKPHQCPICWEPDQLPTKCWWCEGRVGDLKRNSGRGSSIRELEKIKENTKNKPQVSEKQQRQNHERLRKKKVEIQEAREKNRDKTKSYRDIKRERKVKEKRKIKAIKKNTPENKSGFKVKNDEEENQTVFSQVL